MTPGLIIFKPCPKPSKKGPKLDQKMGPKNDIPNVVFNGFRQNRQNHRKRRKSSKKGSVLKKSLFEDRPVFVKKWTPFFHFFKNGKWSISKFWSKIVKNGQKKVHQVYRVS